MESVSRISSTLETTHTLTLDAAREISGLRSSRATPPLRNAQLKKLLDSRHEREVLEGLRRVIALSNRPPIPDEPLLFSSVLKNIASPSSHVKKLIYIHLLQHAESDPDTALLSINTIQKTLSHSDPHLRALALRVMSSIRVPVISQIVLLAIKKGCADMSPLVRKAAALAIPKCARLDPATTAQMEEFLSLLLGDRQYYVAGAAVVAFMELCGWERVDLVHKHYRGLVRKMVDMDEWSQIATLKLMVGYGRRCFPQRWTRGSRSQAEQPNDFYAEEQDTTTTSAARDHLVPLLDPDLELLFKAALPLLQSRNSGVVISVTRLYLTLAPQPPHSTYLTATIGPLIALLRASPDIAQTALYDIIQVALVHPLPFVRYCTHFLLHTTDAPETMRLKLELLTIIFPHSHAHTQSLILSELAHFSASANPSLVRDCVRAVGRCAQGSAAGSTTSARCMRLLLAQLASPSDSLVAESLTVVRHLIQADPHAHVETVTRLAKNLDTMSNTHARASIIWLVGEFASVHAENNIAADVLRILAKGFADEAEPAKLQIVLLAAKVYVHYLNSENGSKDASLHESEPRRATIPSATHAFAGGEGGFQDDNKPTPDEHPIALLFRYILLLSRYDASYDLRDRARFYKALLSVSTATQLASLLLLAPKPAPAVPSPSESRRDFMLGSASLVVGAEQAGASGLRGYEAVPEWVADGQEPDAGLRENGDAAAFDSQRPALSAGDRLDVGAAAAAAATRKPSALVAALVGDKTLDDWLDEEEDEDESETESGGDGEDDESVETESESGEEEVDDEEEEGEEEEEEEEDSAGESSDEETGEREKLMQP